MTKRDVESEGWAAYQGAVQATIADRERLHRLLGIYKAPKADDPAARIVGLGEKLIKAKEAMAKACQIIETGDARLLAQDGPAGNQPPDLSLDEWKTLYSTLNRVLKEL